MLNANNQVEKLCNDTPSLSLFIRLKSALFSYGLKKTLYLVLRNIFIGFESYQLKKFDSKYRIDTIGDVPIGELNVESDNKEHGEGYYSTPFSIIDRYFSALPPDLSDYTFVDVGSGKGRILAYASQYNFKKIVGLEFSADLHTKCEENIRSMQRDSHRCNDIESVLTDATDYQFPDENLVIFMFNPFRGELIKSLLENLEKHQNRYSKKIFIGYYNPRYGYLLEACKFLRPFFLEPPLLFVSVQPLWPLAAFESSAKSRMD